MQVERQQILETRKQEEAEERSNSRKSYVS